MMKFFTASSYLKSWSHWILLLSILQVAQADWNFWWTYDGISGPEFWGILNPDWYLCNKGHRQSPIDIKPGLLLYDPNLRSISISKQRLNGILENNGHSIIFTLNTNRSSSSSSSSSLSSSLQDTSSSALSAPSSFSDSGSMVTPSPLLYPSGVSSSSEVYISGGPLSYSYQFHSLHVHFGRSDSMGSEHSLAGLVFPGEIQIIGFNSDLYSSYEQAASRPNGLVGVAVFLKLSNQSSPIVKLLTSQLFQIKYRGQRATIKSLQLRDLIPDDQSYVTYEGSLTIPSCEEVVTWIVINKPLFIAKDQLASLRTLMQGNQEVPKAPLGHNFRPTQPLYERTIRTSIDFNHKGGEQGSSCPRMSKLTNVHYEINQKLWDAQSSI